MKTELQRLFFEEVQQNFNFLWPRFKGPFPQLDAKTGIFTVVFMGTNLAVEFTLVVFSPRDLWYNSLQNVWRKLCRDGYGCER